MRIMSTKKAGKRSQSVIHADDKIQSSGIVNFKQLGFNYTFTVVSNDGKRNFAVHFNKDDMKQLKEVLRNVKLNG